MRTIAFSSPRRGRALALTSAVVALAASPSSHAAGSDRQPTLREEVAAYRTATWRWQDLADVPRTPTPYSGRRPSPEHRLWLRDLWKRRAAQARRKAIRPPHLAAWLCIQRHEGSWRDPAPPYFGGLQMDLGFQHAYGGELLRRKGTADHWTPLEQMWAAERAIRAGRGFHPWPSAARLCGLL
jgi:hypothetical protein